MTSKRLNDLKPDLKHRTFKVYEYEFEFDKFSIKAISASSASVKITDPIMKQINHELEQVQAALAKQVTSAYFDFMKGVQESYEHLFQQLVKYIIDTDFYTSCAQTAQKYNYCRPNIQDRYNGSSYICTEQIRHPIIERILSFEKYIANNINIGTPDTQGILLYGINSAGKSSISKAIGLCIIMAQAGMYVPASSFTFWPYNEVFTRIPSGDDMMKGQSTFVVEITELRNILKRATPHSLIIGDELASGTESVSAVAIVAAGISQLHQRRASYIFATHLHDLTDISAIKSLQNLGVYHLSVKYDENTDKLIYERQLKPGQGNTLYGLEVCKSLNLGNDFIELANEVRREVLSLNSNALSTKSSRYNRQYYLDSCGICGNTATETHHIVPQAQADQNGFHEYVHKDNVCNLMGVCETCHDAIHNGSITIEGYKQTSTGIELLYK